MKKKKSELREEPRVLGYSKYSNYPTSFAKEN
jgi:hypothetical protein